MKNWEYLGVRIGQNLIKYNPQKTQLCLMNLMLIKTLASAIK